MRFLFATNPGEGHLNPMLPLARALQDAGHDVAFAVAPSFCATVQAKGFQSLPAGLDWLEAEADRVFPEMRELSMNEQGSWFIRDIFADIAAHKMVPDLLAIGREWRPDVLVRNDYEFGSCVAAECLGVPQATISVSFFWSPSILQRQIGDQLAYLRSAYHLPPYPALAMLYPYLYLTYAPPRWQAQAPPVMHAVQFALPTMPDPAHLPPWVKTLSDQPTIYASMGTVNNRTAAAFPMLIEAFGNKPVNLILTIGRNQDPKRWGTPPPNVYIEQYIPQDLLFPYCDLFITSSSFYTVISALWHGVPVLMTPIAGDEPTQAARFADLGAGLILRRTGHRDPILDPSIPELAPQTVYETAQRLLDDGFYANNIQQVRQTLHDLPGLQHGVRLLEKLAQEKQPQVDRLNDWNDR